jgi:hypothetical protein
MLGTAVNVGKNSFGMLNDGWFLLLSMNEIISCGYQL